MSKEQGGAAFRRVVITGMGAVSPAGYGVERLWSKVTGAQCCIDFLPDDERERLGVNVVARIPHYDPCEAGFTKKEARRFSPFVQYAIIAADEAMAQAGIERNPEDAERFACVFGTGIGGIGVFERESVVLHEKGARRVSPLFVPTMIANMAAGDLAIRYGLKGDCLDVTTACATGSHCVGEAYRLIRFGLADAALAGGTEEGTGAMSLAGFANLGAITKSNDPCAASLPFDARRHGFVAGEGAGALVLESLEHAQARGANIIAEVTGFGSTGDAYHITAPEPSGEGAVRAMRQALAEGGFTLEDVGHLNAHGTGTPMNDKVEAAAWRGLLGEELAAKLPVTSIKGVTGHMLGAAGAVEAIVAALSAARGVVPPTAGYAQPDPECPVLVPTSAWVNHPQKVVLSNSLGFGGHNASLALSPFEEVR